MSDEFQFLQSQIDKLKRELEDLRIAENNVFSHIQLKDGITAPSTLTGWAYIYIDTADGDLKIKFGDGTVKTIATDT